MKDVPADVEAAPPNPKPLPPDAAPPKPLLFPALLANAPNPDPPDLLARALKPPPPLDEPNPPILTPKPLPALPEGAVLCVVPNPEELPNPPASDFPNPADVADPKPVAFPAPPAEPPFDDVEKPPPPNALDAPVSDAFVTGAPKELAGALPNPGAAPLEGLVVDFGKPNPEELEANADELFAFPNPAPTEEPNPPLAFVVLGSPKPDGVLPLFTLSVPNELPNPPVLVVLEEPKPPPDGADVDPNPPPDGADVDPNPPPDGVDVDPNPPPDGADSLPLALGS